MHADDVVKSQQQRIHVLPFHRDWIRQAFAPDIEIAVLSCTCGQSRHGAPDILRVSAYVLVARYSSGALKHLPTAKTTTDEWIQASVLW